MAAPTLGGRLSGLLFPRAQRLAHDRSPCRTRWTPVFARRSLGAGLRYRANRRSNSHALTCNHSYPCAGNYAHAAACSRAHANLNTRACADGRSRRAVRNLVVHRRRPCSNRHPRV